MTVFGRDYILAKAFLFVRKMLTTTPTPTTTTTTTTSPTLTVTTFFSNLFYLF
jgi:hypothetical protein